MTLDEYKKLFPNHNISYYYRNTNYQGMLEFTKETAYLWSGPINEIYAYYCITNKNCNITNEQLTKEISTKYYMFPYRFALSQKSIMDKHKIQNLLSQMTKEEIKDMEQRIIEAVNTSFTIEHPWRLYLCGNDDCSYSKFFPTLEQTLEELHTLEVCQPLNMTKDIQENGFYFTN